MDLLTEKVLLLLVLVVLGFGAGVGPHFLKNRCLGPSSFRDKLVSYLNCISAGIFFANFFMHMLPEAIEEIEIAFGQSLEYPLAELVTSLGFFFVLIIEQFVTAWYTNVGKPETEEIYEYHGTIENQHLSSVSIHGITTLLRGKSDTYQSLDGLASHGKSRSIHTAICESVQPATAVSVPAEIEKNGHEGHVHFDASSHTSIRSFVLLFALSAHALFEGLAIGLQSSASALRTLVMAVLIHKMALSFSYGISLVTNNAKWKIVFASLTIFSMMAPTGIGLGAGLLSLKDNDKETEMAIAIMQAFAGGTFVYVIFIEIIPHEFITGKAENRLVKVFYLLIGFAFMAAMQALPHEES